MEIAQSAMDLIVGGFVIVGGIYGALAWGNRNMKKYIESTVNEATRQIHPDANGGRSLNDVAKKVEGVDSKVDTLGKRFDDHLLYHAQQQKGE